MDAKVLLKSIAGLSKEAGDKILAVYNSGDFGAKIKDDKSPLTEADLASHHCILKGLKELTPEIPVLSEESTDIDFDKRKNWSTYWLVDPLDGTKEFIARNGEFTTNIALIGNNKPILGVIYVPVQDTFYFAAKGVGAFKQESGQEPTTIKVRSIPIKDNVKHYTIVASRRHGLDKVEALCRAMPSYDLTSRGSSLKMCLVAEGKADLYPRLAPTSEWDTAAAQIIVEEAGGQLVKTDFSNFLYNTKQSLINPHFFVLGDSREQWRNLLALH